MVNYIGIDIASQTLEVYDGKKSVVVPNIEKLFELRRLLKESLGKEWKTAHLLYEPTGIYSSYVEQFARKHGLKAYAVNPKRSFNFARALGNRSKTDPIDAKMLYDYHKLLSESDWEVPTLDQDLDAICHDLCTYEFIQKTWVQMGNHLHALKRGKTVNAATVSFLEKEIQRLKEEEKVLAKEMETKTKSSEALKDDFARITSIPCIGPMSAIVLLMMFRRYKDTSRTEITALLGLDPTRRTSGSSVSKKDRISKQGNRFARKILFMSALNGSQNNDRMKIFYQRLLDNHKPPKVAIIAVMRKLALIAHQLYIKKEFYQPLP
jgi:transposase